ncbi:E3 ubiquitin-protein ligase [Smittium culicis]|uniref:RING-type E3 ubiquitin transferase n=1 Tax=Smittium culicis TaxID=133412 RepID=A0A1R1XIN4_9FUNG|nr:E3 ubiquitin-protein ligase [Smittium culicis]
MFDNIMYSEIDNQKEKNTFENTVLDIGDTSKGKNTEEQKTTKSSISIFTNTLNQVKSGFFGSILNKDINCKADQYSVECSECLICFDSINPGEIIRGIPCTHVFHKDCLDVWLISRLGSCPTCRFDLRPLKEKSTFAVIEVSDISANTNQQSLSNPRSETIEENQINHLQQAHHTINVASSSSN